MQFTSDTQDIGMLQGAVVGETPEIQKIYQIIQTAARTTNPVLIIGERGTGKEVIATSLKPSAMVLPVPPQPMTCTDTCLDNSCRGKICSCGIPDCVSVGCVMVGHKLF